VTREQMLGQLRRFVLDELLDGRDTGLDERTPLLAWGVLDSLSVNQLLSFTRERFGIEVPPDQVTPDNLQDLDSYTGLLTRLG
jgi:medium-chain acyl-[acyl-carrier-protein] hydrolase